MKQRLKMSLGASSSTPHAYRIQIRLYTCKKLRLCLYYYISHARCAVFFLFLVLVVESTTGTQSVFLILFRRNSHTHRTRTSLTAHTHTAMVSCSLATVLFTFARWMTCARTSRTHELHGCPVSPKMVVPNTHTHTHSCAESKNQNKTQTRTESEVCSYDASLAIHTFTFSCLVVCGCDMVIQNIVYGGWGGGRVRTCNDKRRSWRTTQSIQDRR